MTPRSLRWRLLAASGVAVSAALAITWLLMSLVFSRHLERRLILEMSRDATDVIAMVDLDESGRLAVGESPLAPRFQRPARGHYWQVSGGGTDLRSRSLWDTALPQPEDAAHDSWRLRRALGPFDKPVFIVYRSVRFASDDHELPAVVQIARDQSETSTAQAEFGREMAIFLFVLWLFLMAAGWVQVQLGLRPLKALDRELKRLREDPSRRLPTPWLHELDPLAQAINALTDARAADLKRARSRTADLAHRLKTPLAALMTQSSKLRDEVPAETAQRLDHALGAIHAAIRTELSRDRFAELAPGVSPILGPVEKLTQVLEQTERGALTLFDIEVPEDLRVPLIEDDVIELLGPLLENAVRFRRRRVLVAGRRAGGTVEIAVEDDGPGIPPDRILAATLRGVRLDERGEGLGQGLGQGLGLSIAKQIAEASGGELRLRPSSLGGLRVVIRWPDPAGSSSS